MPLQLPDIFLIQSSSGFVPEFNGSLELLDIIIAQPCRQSIQQKQGIGFPGMALRQGNIPIPHSLGSAVNTSEIGPLHSSHQPDPDFRVDDPV